MELAVVSTAVSGIPEVIEDGVNGLLVRPCDTVALAVAIGRVLDDWLLRRRLGEAARRTVATEFRSDDNLQVVRRLLRAASRGASAGWPAAPVEMR